MTAKKRGPMKLSDIEGDKSQAKGSRTPNGRGQKISGETKSPVSKPAKKVNTSKQNMTEEPSNASQLLLDKAKKLQENKASSKEPVPTTDKDEGTEPQSGAISLIEVQKKNKKRFNIYINGAFAFGISENTLVKFALHKGQELDADFIKEIQQVDKEDYAYQLAVRFLSHQLRSEKQVRDKLAEEEIEPEVMETAIAKLKDIKLIDDSIYGQSYTRTAMNLNKKGPNVIAQELKRKGLDQEEIDQSLAEYDQSTLNENAYELAEKYFIKQLRKASHRTSIQKTKQHLIQKGYSSDVLQEIMDELAETYQDEDQELEVLRKDLEKYMRRYRKLQGKELMFKVKGMLFNKGYSSELISQVMNEYEENM